MSIRRQDAETTIHELAGAECDGLIGLGRTRGELELLFLRAGGIWHRLFLDEGVLFWGPWAPEDEHSEMPQFGLLRTQPPGAGSIETITMVAGVLTVRFGGGVALVVTEAATGDLQCRWESTTND